MKDIRFRDTVHRQTLTDEFGYSFSIAVPVTMIDLWMDGNWEETINCGEHRKIERAIEQKYPGWFHRCYNDPEGHCPACARKAEARKLGLKSCRQRR